MNSNDDPFTRAYIQIFLKHRGHRYLSLHINENEFVSIIGPSGSGKSTIFHLIGGIMTPDTGMISLKGKNINGERGSISYMPQSPSL